MAPNLVGMPGSFVRLYLKSCEAFLKKMGDSRPRVRLVEDDERTLCYAQTPRRTCPQEA